MPQPNGNTMNALIGKIYDLMTAPDTVNNGVTDSRGSTYMSFAAPGMPIDKAGLDFGDLSTKDQINANARFSQLVNSAPNPTGFYSTSGTKIWDVYERALENIDLPAAELSEREKTMLAKAQGFLNQQVTKTDPFTDEQTTELRPTPQYEAYSALFTAYQAALHKYNDALKNAKSANATTDAIQDWNLNGAIMQQAVVQAYQRWGSAGYRDYVDSANGIISNLMGKGPQIVYDRLKAAFKMSSRKDLATGETYYSTLVYPGNVLGTAYNDSWTTFSFTDKDIADYGESHALKVGGGVSGAYGGVTASVSGSYGKETSSHEIDSRGMSLSVDLLQVPLIRPWFTRWIFSSRGWRFSPGMDQTVSDGQEPPHGLMPLFPTSLVLARNLKLTLDTSCESNKSALETIAASGSVSYGPFALKADFAKSDGSSSHALSVTSSGLSVTGAQIIAFVCDVLPKSPDPDPSLGWTSAAAVAVMA